MAVSLFFVIMIGVKDKHKKEGIWMRVITKQEREDYLEAMYGLRRKENQIIKSDLAREFEAAMSRVTKVTDELVAQGYLWKDENRHLYLTEMGLTMGKEYQERKQCLTEFLRLVSGVDHSLARENACAIEHVLDERILTGIHTFMERRHTYSYTMQGNDLKLMFPEGKRQMPIAFYEKGSACPRRLAKEYDWFLKKAMVEIGEESVLYLSPLKEEVRESHLYYRVGEGWKEAAYKKQGFAIPTKAFYCVIRKDHKISEGSLEITLAEETELEEEDHRSCLLNVSLI